MSNRTEMMQHHRQSLIQDFRAVLRHYDSQRERDPGGKVRAALRSEIQRLEEEIASLTQPSEPRP